VPYLLDTDTVSNFLARNRNYETLRERVLMQPEGEIFISIITVEEIFGGAVSAINSARSKGAAAQVISRYALLEHLYNSLRKFSVLPYEVNADELFQKLEPKVRKAHGLDCRIAAVAVAHGCIVVTANLQHYQKIGLAPAESWI
jgi:predicted nucleic acid-binding protein